MRSEKEMLDLIIAVANNDIRIRAVYLEGSRANPNVSKNIFQDNDIVFVVTETRSFRENKDWINSIKDKFKSLLSIFIKFTFFWRLWYSTSL
ncbi:streptomycin adenylyltransferase [Alkalibaculum bacchi]|jgi:aminoglycoside 6-adenylyltransferase|uniref:Streptomycin adenylyltransferase n=1 Tax=Alkalibaculum bacchi TaxID=645887 RepID=A0A366I9K2_9FIRM|nr:aminoglycoside 6-adenylyltransferase [Alkalibaculum bacchi]RBP66632.1 streptomycin adenylyltransferase [Alkalibaculum bacchi]